MQCEEVREQFTDHVINDIQPAARLAIERHLVACESCKAEVDELKTLWTSLGSIPAAEPGPELRARFQVMLEAYQHGLGKAPSVSRRERLNSWLAGWWPRQPALQAAIGLALLILGLTLGRGFSPAPAVQPVAEIAELRTELSQMRQMVTLSLMQQQSASDRLKGVSWSSQLQHPDGEVLTALLDTLTHDPNVNVRLATVDALRQFGSQPVVRRGVVDAMDRQVSPMVQIALIDLAVDLNEKESIETLRRLTRDQQTNTAVRARAEKGISELE